MTFLEFFEALLRCAIQWGCREGREEEDGGEGCGEESESNHEDLSELERVFSSFFEGQFLPQAKAVLCC